jgi:hypothetical protein
MPKENKNKGAGKPAPKGDTTQKRRQSRRREKLQEIAQAAGFASWYAYETAVLNGLTSLTPFAADGGYCTCNSSTEYLKDGVWLCGFCRCPRR